MRANNERRYEVNKATRERERERKTAFYMLKDRRFFACQRVYQPPRIQTIQVVNNTRCSELQQSGLNRQTVETVSAKSAFDSCSADRSAVPFE